MLPGQNEFEIMFNTKTDGWGSFQYNNANDALRITVKPVKAEPEEWMSFNFSDLAGTSAVAFVHWAELKIPFKIEVSM